MKKITIKNPTEQKKRFQYKGFTCIWNEEIQAYLIYTKEEMEQPKGFRYPEIEAETVEICKDFIDSY
jgi:hypothetical protein